MSQKHLALIALFSLLISTLNCSVTETSGESHFGSTKSLFRVCEDGLCEGSDTCACAVCTVPCQSLDDCAARLVGPGSLGKDLPDNVVCQAPGCFPKNSKDAQPGDGGGVCEALCEADADCDFIADDGASHHCVGGYCRSKLDPTHPEPAPILGPACPEGRLLVPGSVTESGTGYCLDQHEITVELFRGCVESGACTAPTAGNYLTATREQHPVHYVSVDQAESYCSYADSRLPTRDEWSTAAVRASSDLYPFGDSAPLVTDMPRLVCALDATTTCEVGQATGDGPFGHADLSGNVAEIVIDGSIPCAIGGSFESDAAGLTVETCAAQTEPGATVGFRCLSDL